MSRRKDRIAAKDMTFAGRKYVLSDELDPASPAKLYFFRPRKARRAQARIDGYVWRAMSEHQRLSQ